MSYILKFFCVLILLAQIPAPAWFGRVWKIMKPMLSPAFRKKVHMIPEEKLSKHLSPGFEAHLPNEFKCGKADVPSMVQDFITFRKYAEGGAFLAPEQPIDPHDAKQQQQSFTDCPLVTSTCGHEQVDKM